MHEGWVDFRRRGRTLTSRTRGERGAEPGVADGLDHPHSSGAPDLSRNNQSNRSLTVVAHSSVPGGRTQAPSRYREEAVLPKRVAICQRRYLPCTAMNTLLPLRLISSSVGREPEACTPARTSAPDFTGWRFTWRITSSG